MELLWQIHPHSMSHLQTAGALFHDESYLRIIQCSVSVQCTLLLHSHSFFLPQKCLQNDIVQNCQTDNLCHEIFPSDIRLRTSHRQERFLCHTLFRRFPIIPQRYFNSVFIKFIKLIKPYYLLFYSNLLLHYTIKIIKDCPI